MIIFILILIGFCILLFVSVVFRTLFFNFFKSVLYALKDFYKFIRYKKFNNGKYLGLIAFCGLFGHGKTLSAVHFITKYYDKYNNRLVWVGDHFARQYVQIFSNVELQGYPYIYLSSLDQIVNLTKDQAQYDIANDVVTLSLILIDEASVQLNSRNFKSNIDPLFLSTLLTSRHFNIMSLVYTSQKFCLTDKLLRDVTEKVYICKKCWRVMCHNVYDASDLEQTSDISKVKPLHRFGWFIFDSDFAKYNTMATVDNLVKDCIEGNMIPEADILALQGVNASDPEAVSHKSFKFKRKLRKEQKTN